MPDYFQTVISLCEIIRQFYIRLQQLVSTAPTPASRADGSQYGSIASRKPSASARTLSLSGGMSSPFDKGANGSSSALTPALCDLITTADGRFKVRLAAHLYPSFESPLTWNPPHVQKILSQLTKDIETVARSSAAAELTALLPGFSSQDLRASAIDV